MNQQPTQGQIKEFWEWCGFNLVNGVVWIDGQNNRIHKESPIDLDNLFKYAVPKLDNLSLGNRRYLLLRWMSDVVEKDSDPALALFWAIWDVIQ